jgi:thymidylate kinase
MKGDIIFISGVCGVGKTSIIPFLKKGLKGKKYDIHDFDERGVPEGAGREWRIKESLYWATLGKQNIEQNIFTIICGFSRPSELLSLLGSKKTTLILLDIKPKILKERLSGRYQTKESVVRLKAVTGKGVEKFIEDNINFSSILRDECKKFRCEIIDTSELAVKDVAQKVIDVVGKNIE